MADQLARGLFNNFAPNEYPFAVPNGMEENLRTIDDHLGLYTLAAPQAPATPLPVAPAAGDGQIYTNGTYKVFNGGTWRAYPARKGVLASLPDGTATWQNTGSGWTEASPAYTPLAGHGEFWPSVLPTQVRQAIDYLAQRVGSDDYNLLDPKWGIVQKLSGGLVSVRAEIQAVLDYAQARRNVLTDRINKMRVYAPGATYPVDGPLFNPSWIVFEGERANYEYFGACFWALNNFNAAALGGLGTGGFMIRVKSQVDPTSGAAFWGGTFSGFNMRGAVDGSCHGGFATINETGANVELQDTACIDFNSCRYINGPGMRIYGGVPNYIRRFRPYCCNGPGILLIGNVGRHNITHIDEISGDQCHNGLVQLENWADADVCVITAMKSERASATHSATQNVNEFWPILASWKDAGHDGQKNAITFKNCTGGRVAVNGVHHISAWNAKQVVTVVGDVFTMPTKSELVEGSPVRFVVAAGGTLPTGLVANTDYYAHVTGPKTFQVATTLGAVGTGPYVTPVGGSGELSADPGYLTAGDVFAVLSGQVPNLQWSGAFARHRPWPGDVERIGPEPWIISNIPAGDNTGTTPRFVSFPRSQMSGQISRDAPICFLGTSAAGTRATKVLAGGTAFPTSDLNEDCIVGSIGNLPAFGLLEEDAPVGSKIALLRMNAGTVHLTGINETNGDFYNWISFPPNGHVQINERLVFVAGKNIQTDTVTGTSFGQTAAQRVGFHGSQSTQATGLPAAATDLATALTLLNFIRTAGVNKGLWAA